MYHVALDKIQIESGNGKNCTSFEWKSYLYLVGPFKMPDLLYKTCHSNGPILFTQFFVGYEIKNGQTTEVCQYT